MNTKITLIKPITSQLVSVPAPPNAAKSQDRAGGVEQGFVSTAIGNAVANLDADIFLNQLDVALGQVQLIADRILKQAGRLKASELTLGLAISAEGSIGVATAGAEASIEITFEIT